MPPAVANAAAPAAPVASLKAFRPAFLPVAFQVSPDIFFLKFFLVPFHAADPTAPIAPVNFCPLVLFL